MDISNKLSQILGREIPESLKTTLDGYDSNTLTTISDDADVEELSDAELYEIAEKLLEDNPSDDAQEIAQAIFRLIAQDGDIDANEETKETDTPTDPIDYQAKVDDLEAIKTATDSDTDLTELTAELPTGFDLLSPEEQAVIIEYYQTQGTGDGSLYEKAIKAVPTDNLDDVIAELYGDDTTFGTTDSDETINDLNDFLTARFENNTARGGDIKAILSPDGAFADMGGAQQANLVTGLLKAASTESDGTKKNDLEKAIIDTLKENGDFKDAVKKNMTNANTIYKALTDANYTKGALLTASDSTAFQTNLATTLNTAYEDKDTTTGKTTGETTAQGLMQEIIETNPRSTADISSKVTTAMQSFIDNDASNEDVALNIATLKDFFDEILTNNGGLTDDEYKSVLNGIINSYKKLTYNTVSRDYSAKIKTAFDDALADAYDADANPTRLASGFDITTATTITLDTNNSLCVSQDALDAIDSYIAGTTTDLTGIELDALFTALQDPKNATNKPQILQAIMDKALTEGTNLKELHKTLQFFPDMLDELDALYDNNSDNPILEFLTEPYPLDDENEQTPYTDKLAQFKYDQTLFVDILSKASDDTDDSTTIINYPRRFEPAHSLIDTDAVDEAQKQAFEFAIKDYDSTTSTDEQRNEIFKPFTNLSSDFYVNGSSKETRLEDLLDWLETQAPEIQKAFLDSIPKNSELHLALMDLADELMTENDDDSDDYKLGQALQNVTDNISNDKDISDSDISTLFTASSNNDDDVINLTSKASDIISFADNSDIVRSDDIEDFIDIMDNSTEVSDFLDELDDTELTSFFDTLLHEDSLMLKGKNTNFDTGIANLLTALFTAGNEAKLLEFLQEIPNNEPLMAILESKGITEEDIDDADSISDFDDDLKTVLTDTFTAWKTTSSLDSYKDRLDDANDQDEYNAIFDDAKATGQLDALLQDLASDDSDYLEDEDVIEAMFAYLSENDTDRDTFLEKLPQDSYLELAMQSLIDKKVSSNNEDEDEDDTIEYDDFDDIIKSDTLDALFDEIDNIKATEGADNKNLRNLIGDINSGKEIDFDTYLAVDDDDEVTDDAETLIELITTDNNFLFDAITDPEKLSTFIKNFLNHINKNDELRDTLEGTLSTDSAFYRALIAAGAKPEELDPDSDDFNLKDTLNDADDYETFVNSIGLSKKRSEYSDITDFMTETLVDVDKNSDIEDAVKDILDFAFAAPDDLEELLSDISGKTGSFSDLTEEQRDILIKALFDRLASEKPISGNEFTDNQSLFLSTLQNGTYLYDNFIKNNPDYTVINQYVNGEEYDTKDLGNESGDLFDDTNLIDDFVKKEIPEYAEEDDDETENGISGSDNSDIYSTQTIEAGYDALEELDIDTDNELSSSFFLNNGTSAEALGKKVAQEDLSTNKIMGLVSIMPPADSAKFIQSFFENDGGGDGDNELVSLLMGQLLIMQANGNISDTEFEDVINSIGDNEAIKTFFGDSSTVTDLINDPNVVIATIGLWQENGEKNTLFNKNYDIDSDVSKVINYIESPTDDSDNLGIDDLLNDTEATEEIQNSLSATQNAVNMEANGIPIQQSQAVQGGYSMFPPQGVGGMGMPQMPIIPYPSPETMFLRGMVAGLTGQGMSPMLGSSMSPMMQGGMSPTGGGNPTDGGNPTGGRTITLNL